MILPLVSISLLATKLAFIQNGNVWVDPSAGSTLQLTRYGGTSNPRWSASGNWISFRQNRRDLVIMPADGDRQRMRVIASYQNGGWSPVRDEIAFLDDDGLCVVSMDRPNQKKRVVMKNSGSRKAIEFKWRTDGHGFAVVSGSRLVVVNEDGTKVDHVYAAPAGDGIGLAGWSSDNRNIIFWLDPEHSASVAADGIPLHSVPASGGEARTLFSEVLVHDDFIRGTDKRSDLLVIAGGNRDSWTNKRLVLVDPASGKSTSLTDSSVAVAAAAWSPDGNMIAYSSGPNDAEAGGGEAARRVLMQRRIWIITPDGTGNRQLTHDPHYRDEHPQWSSDGKSIIFCRLDDKDTVSVWRVQVSDGSLEKLTDNIHQQVTFAPGITGPLWFGYYGYIAWDEFVAWSTV